MAKVKLYEHYATVDCPGCGGCHTIDTQRWTFNGNLDKPTITPSLLSKSGHFVDGIVKDCWCDFEERFGKKPGFECHVCHSFIADGKIQFLNDSTHKLAGQTVELPEVN